MTTQQFLYRHSKFTPTTQNVFLLGLAAGAALVAIVAVLVAAISAFYFPNFYFFP